MYSACKVQPEKLSKKKKEGGERGEAEDREREKERQSRGRLKVELPQWKYRLEIQEY